MRARSLVIYAPNVASGGGVSLLRMILSVQKSTDDMFFYLDGRLFSQELHANINLCNGKILGRLKSELFLRKLDARCTLLSFNSLPAPFFNGERHFVYFHNVRIFDRLTFKGFLRETKVSVRLFAEKLLFHVFKRKVNIFFVQTNSAKQMLVKCGGVEDERIILAPFCEHLDDNEAHQVGSGQTEFLYLADGSSHKNHLVLFEAWRLLAGYGFKPVLNVTLSNANQQLIEKIAYFVSVDGINIQNLGVLARVDALDQLRKSSALIYPSKKESFGLPLIEATNLNVPILASELDYVRDVCNPEETFDPDSPLSIARSVMRFMGKKEGLPTVLTPDQFLKKLMTI